MSSHHTSYLWCSRCWGHMAGPIAQSHTNPKVKIFLKLLQNSVRCVDMVCDSRFVLLWPWSFFCDSCIFTSFLLFYFFPMFFHVNSKTLSCFSNIDLLTVFARNPVNAFCFFFCVYLILLMDQHIFDGGMRSHGRRDSVCVVRSCYSFRRSLNIWEWIKVIMLE